MNEAPRIARLADAPVHQLHGEGSIRKLVYPDTVGSQKLFIGLAIVPPGEAPHVFHRHGVEEHGTTRIEYADEFEEFYFVVAGSGEMQWIEDNGSQTASEVKQGDAIYMPRGCLAHRIFNSGATEMRVLYGGTPPAKITKLAQ